MNDTATISKMSNCSKHKKEVAGISDMKLLAEMIGDLHYESLSEFLKELSKKLKSDSDKDFEGGRNELGFQLYSAYRAVLNSYYAIKRAWEISKPFMNE